ncbi:MAG: hypothetical protein MHPSP_002012, partial [Paramarteilia canceri]
VVSTCNILFYSTLFERNKVSWDHCCQAFRLCVEERRELGASSVKYSAVSEPEYREQKPIEQSSAYEKQK